LLHEKVRGTRDINRLQAPGYLPNEAFPLAQFLLNAGFLPFLNVSAHEGIVKQRETLRKSLAENLFYGRSHRFTSGVCKRPVAQFPGLAQVQCTVHTWKPAVCIAYGAPVHIEDKPHLCEACERAGIVPIYICCRVNDSWDRNLRFQCGLRGKEHLLTVYSFEDAVRLLCKLNTNNDLVDLVKAAQSRAWRQPWSNEREGHVFNHLN
jgi:hypothetical protein